jgi:hypothetical protein
VIPRQVCIHIGTHKTGTKALQVFLAMNRPLLQTVGIHYPILGRVDLGGGFRSPGQHQVAMEFLAGGPTPAFDAILAEIDTVNLLTVVISSEEFQILLNVPAALATIAQQFTARGYSIHPIVYFRAQPYYAESLFSEFAKGNYHLNLESFFETIVTDGFFEPPGSNRRMQFVYSRIVEQADAFAGVGKTVVRAYHPEREATAIFDDFLRTVGRLRGELRIDGLSNPLPRTNESYTFVQLLEAIHKIIVPQDGGIAQDERPWLSGLPDIAEDVLNARFSLLTHADVVRFLDRFADDNRALNERYGIDIPFTGPQDLPSPSDSRFVLARIHRNILSRAIDTWSAPGSR